jgi:small subunit ribosomal protein S15
MPLAAERRTSIVKDYAIHAGDSGSPEVQVALLTERMSELNEHLKTHDHDKHSRRGLILMVGKRNKLLKYLARADRDRYTNLISRLGLRK